MRCSLWRNKRVLEDAEASEPKRLKTANTNDQDQSKEDFKDKLQLRPAIRQSEGATILASIFEFTTEILPPELWEQVFTNVESPKDLLNCWKTYPAWAAALRSTDFYFKMTLPFVLPYLIRSDLLACSAASKSWSAAVDACIQYVEDFSSDPALRLDTYERIELKLDSNNMSDFLNRVVMSNNESGETNVAVNSVAYRRVNVLFRGLDYGDAVDDDEDEEEIESISFLSDRMNLLQFFDRHGHLIRHLHLRINSTTATFPDKLKLIQSCLMRTPNLQVANISVSDFTLPEFRSDEKMELEAFNVYISNNPWPSLKHLKVLKFGQTDFQDEFVTIANAYAPQLLYLHFGFPLVKPFWPLSNRFSCLQKISYMLNESPSGMEFGAFVRSSQCPLKHLTITFQEYPGAKNRKGLTMAANAASDTLETLVFYNCIQLSKRSNFDVTKFNELRLPRLKVFELSGFGYPAFDFFQTVCPSLQTLEVAPAESGGSRMLKNHEKYGDLYSEHQFWGLLASIKSVGVICTVKVISVDGEDKQKFFGDNVYKTYTRRCYEILERNRAIGIYTQS